MRSLQKLLLLLRERERNSSRSLTAKDCASFVPQLTKANLPLPEPSWQESDWLRLTLALEHDLGQGLADHDIGITTQDQIDRNVAIMPVTLVADHIRSAMNVGSMARSLEFFGAENFATIGYTPALDHPLVQKTSLGAESYLKKDSFPTLAEALVALKVRKIQTVAFETCERAIAFPEWQPIFPLALIFGHERNGIAAQDLQACDQVVAIPGYGRKNSLNVAVTTGIVLQKVRQAWQEQK